MREQKEVTRKTKAAASNRVGELDDIGVPRAVVFYDSLVFVLVQGAPMAPAPTNPTTATYSSYLYSH